MKTFKFVAAAVLLAGSANSEILAGFDFYGQTGKQASSPAGVSAAGMNVSALARGAGVLASGASSAYTTNNFTSMGYTAYSQLAQALSNNDYVSFSLAVSNGSTVSYTGLVFGASVRNSGSPTTNALYAIIGSSTQQLSAGVVCRAVMGSGVSTAYSNFVFNLSGFSALQNVAAGTAVEFRWYSYGGIAEGSTETVMIGRDRNTQDVLDLYVEGTVDSGTQYTLTVNANPGGSATGGGTYNDGQNPQITATASNGFLFVNWTGAVTSVNSTTNVLMTADKIVWANFTTEPPKATVFYVK